MPEMPAPRAHESKQSYLRRCVAQCTADGMAENEAFAVCALACRQANLSGSDDPRLQQLCAPVRLLAANDDANPAGDDADGGEQSAAERRFAILGYTGVEVEVWGYRFVIDLNGISMKTAIPALREHERDRIVGMTDESRVDAQGLHLFGTFSKATPDAAEVLALADEGFPWQASIGVRALQVLQVEAGASATVNGRVVRGPIDIWQQSQVGEISFVALGADSNTVAIAMSAENQEVFMDPKLRAVLLRLGMPETADHEQAQIFYNEHKDQADAQLTVQVRQTPAPSPAPQPEPAPTPPAPAGEPDVNAAVQAALAMERERVNGINTLCAKLNLGMDAATRMVERGLSLDAARAEAVDLLAARPGGSPVGRVDMGQDESDVFRALAAEGIAMTNGVRVEKPQDGSRRFRNMGLADFVRLTLERAGCSCAGLSRSDMADRLFSTTYRLTASTSDFAAVFMDVSNKILLQAYAESGRTFEPWTTRRTARDFKEIYGISLSEAPDFDLVREGAEYKDGALRDHAESFRIAKYGKILSITWEMIVNDDLGAFIRVPQLFGAAWGRKQSDIIYGLLTGNPTMADGNAVFSVPHDNVVATGTGIDDEGMSAARQKMRMQKGMNGARLNITPSFLLVPPSLENEALVLLNSAAAPDANMSSGVYNPWRDSRITPIVEARLEPDSGPAAWYLTASPNQVSTIDVAYLNGQDAPDVVEEMSFRTDAISYKARGCMGAGWMDWRGVVKNPGKTGA